MNPILAVKTFDSAKNHHVGWQAALIQACLARLELRRQLRKLADTTCLIH
jgi:hypothetical protein